jgi:hypothetical protein
MFHLLIFIIGNVQFFFFFFHFSRSVGCHHLLVLMYNKDQEGGCSGNEGDPRREPSVGPEFPELPSLRSLSCRI